MRVNLFAADPTVVRGSGAIFQGWCLAKYVAGQKRHPLTPTISNITHRPLTEWEEEQLVVAA